MTNNSANPLMTVTEQPFLGETSTQDVLTTTHKHHETDLTELAWIIPMVLAGVVIMFIIALLCYYGVRRTELFMMQWCYRKYGCCKPTENEEYTNLKEAFDPESYSLNGMHCTFSTIPLLFIIDNETLKFTILD